MNSKSKVVLSAMLACGLLAGCGSKGDNAQPEAGASSAPKEEKVSLTFWRNSGNDAENSAYDKLVASFNEAHPNIKVEMSPIPYADYDTKLRTSIASGSPPDIMAVDGPNMASYAQAGALQPLTAFFKKDGNLEDIPESTIATYTYNNEIYMAPLTESSIALFL
ncbi:ABC transporter substrate-binding protein [Paenibacillus rhizoplanae]